MVWQYSILLRDLEGSHLISPMPKLPAGNDVLRVSRTSAIVFKSCMNAMDDGLTLVAISCQFTSLKDRLKRARASCDAAAWQGHPSVEFDLTCCAAE